MMRLSGTDSCSFARCRTVCMHLNAVSADVPFIPDRREEHCGDNDGGNDKQTGICSRQKYASNIAGGVGITC